MSPPPIRRGHSGGDDEKWVGISGGENQKVGEENQKVDGTKRVTVLESDKL